MRSLIPDRKKKIEIHTREMLSKRDVRLGSGQNPLIQMAGIKTSIESMKTKPAHIIMNLGKRFFMSAI
jgi:hypothetical protein